MLVFVKNAVLPLHLQKLISSAPIWKYETNIFLNILLRTQVRFVPTHKTLLILMTFPELLSHQILNYHFKKKGGVSENECY